MNINIIVVGKLKEKYLLDAENYYKNKINSTLNLSIIELPDESIPANASTVQQEQIKLKETERIEKHIKAGSYTIVLDLQGKKLNSQEFSHIMKRLKIQEKEAINFIIGGSLGIHRALIKKANFNLCLSDLTFPHQVVRVILLEQLSQNCEL